MAAQRGRSERRGRGVLARQGWVGEKSGLFEHPVEYHPIGSDVQKLEVLAYPNSFSAAC